MLKQLEMELKLQKKSFLIPLAVFAASFLVGFVILLIIMHTDGESWIPLGTMIALLIFVMLIFLLRSYSFYLDFLMALSMGRTRKEYLSISVLRMVLENLVFFLLFFLFYTLEMHLYPLLFPGSTTEVSLAAGTVLKFMVPVFFLSILIPLWAGTLLAVYGRKTAGITLYFLWLFSLLMTPRILLPEAHSGSILDRVGYGVHQFVAEAPNGLLFACTAVLLALLFVWTKMLSKKIIVK